MKLKWRGIHTLIAASLGDALTGARVLDVGCGYGRFCFMAARRAAEVVGIDMTPQPIEVAEILKRSLDAPNVTFFNAELDDDFDDGEPYDIVVLGGVLEHLIEPDAIIRSIAARLKPGGLLVSNSPTESNFRGDVSTTLLRLFNFPMSLTDVRIVTPEFMQELGARRGFEVTKTLGVMYSRAWGAMACRDLTERLENVLKDVADQVGGMQVSKAAFDAWIEQRATENALLLEDWRQRGVLKAMPHSPPLPFSEAVLEEAGLPVADVLAYMAPENDLEPWYSDVAPYNRLGGQSIFFLRKL